MLYLTIANLVKYLSSLICSFLLIYFIRFSMNAAAVPPSDQGKRVSRLALIDVGKSLGLPGDFPIGVFLWNFR